MSALLTRRELLRATLGTATALALPDCAVPVREERLFQIGLCQWSYHPAFYAGELSALDFPQLARTRYGVHGVDWVNSLLLRTKGGSAEPPGALAFFRELRARCDAQDVRSLVLLLDMPPGVPLLGAS